ncbi:calcium/manganese antiporter SLC30A10 isoform X1 [Hyla sarda]|uniref:calcium/manganese antiporter SLC30A10 isoform X1 n=1 Tax=Hyla sarda TaxID=327740 RepID=UPI0024C3CEA5|nr:calcium/manganese antiporter SLC30A10 isoform X1 [Hyla sarda]
MGRYTGKTCRLIFMLVLTVIFFVAELVSGYLGNSIALISDSFNMLSDLISLCVGITASRVSRRKTRGPTATYGYTRAEVVGALCNAVFLTALCFTILVDSILRLAKPEKIDGPELVLIVGALGLGVNIVGLLVFQDYGRCIRFLRGRKGQQEPEVANKDRLEVTPYQAGGNQGSESLDVNLAGDYIDEQDSDLEEEKDQSGKNAAALNIRGVLLHVMGDALGSVVVVVAAVIFYIKPLAPDAPCNWQCYIDPSLTVVMVAIILFSAFPLIKETATILLQMVPKDINVGEIGDKISMVPGVKSIHEIHVWELASGKNIATLHVKFQNLQDYILANRNIRKIFHSQGIHAVTLQAEFTDAKDFSLECNAPCISKKCDEYLCCSQELVPFAETDGKALKKGKSSQVWYRSNDTNTDVEIPIDSNEGIPEVKVVANGLHSENQALNDKVTRL